MRFSFRKKAMAIVLAVLILTSVLPVGAGVAATCAGNAHTPDKTTLYPADWNSTNGGYPDDYYLCSACGAACDANGFNMVFVGAGNGCSGGRKCHVPGNSFTICDGTVCYYCTACGHIVDAAGTVIDGSSGGGHSPNISEPNSANYKVCTGGYQTTFYYCQTCGFACDANGNGLTCIRGTGAHNPDKTTLYPADWNTATGGYSDDYYLCTYCGAACDVHGAAMMFVGAGNGCSGGRKCHLPGTMEYPANYTVCNGGYKVNYYLCTSCNREVDAQGTVVEFSEATSAHSPDTDNPYPSNYTACGGGFKSTHYACKVCHTACDASGSDITWNAPTSSVHSPDTNNPQPANYTVCGGGYKTTWYECKACGTACDSAGSSMSMDGGNGVHSPDTDNPHPADYTACGGGFTSTWYECKVCGASCDENGDGNSNIWSAATVPHSPDTANPQPANYTACGGGHKSTWYFCTVCSQHCDASGSDISWDAPTSSVHSPDTDNPQSANYAACNGGYKSTWYFCTVCSQPCDASGSDISWDAPTSSVHSPDTNNPQPANYTVCSGGCKTTWYMCTYCGAECDANGDSSIWSAPTAAHSPDLTNEHTANYTACGGGHKSTWYECTVCGYPCDANGGYVEWSAPTATPHTPDLNNEQPANYVACGGGYKSAFYICTVCNQPCNADGTDAVYTGPTTTTHNLGEKQPANYEPCGLGGYKTDYYKCVDCNNCFDENGNSVVWSEPTGKHTPRADKWEANYTVCGGGYKDAYYLCEYCNRACDINGNDMVWQSGNGAHTPDEGHKADWTACGGGYKADYYLCIYCGVSCDAEGNCTNAWETPTMDAKHTSSGELHKANYTDCGGGYDKDYYICDVCGNAFDTDGYTVLNFDPLTRHTPDTANPHPADYTACGGGYKSTWYECKVCNQPCDANGDNAVWSEPTEGHDLKKVDAADPTYESSGNTEYWVCKVCDNYFSDAQGKNLIEDKDSVIIPKLEYVTAVTELSEVPESVSDKYPTVDDVSKALVEAAFAADTTLVKEDADSVVLDVVLETKSSDGAVTPVTQESFPEEGVDVVLAYPEGTDDSYQFVITHMITYGDLAGTIENMEYTLEEDGIHVHFSSMSPVCITYQKTAVKPVGDANGDGEINSRDAVLVLSYCADDSAEGIDLAAADVNGDGEIDSRDAVAILRLCAENQN